MAAAILQNIGDAAGSADAGNGGRGKRNRSRFRQFAENVVHMKNHVDVLFVFGFALAPGFKCDPEKRAVSVLHAAQHVEADHRSYVLDARRLHQDVFHFCGARRRALQRSRIGQLLGNENIALVFIGKKAGGQLASDHAGQNAESCQQDYGERHLMNEHTANLHIVIRGGVKHAGDQPKNLPSGPRASFLGRNNNAESAGLSVSALKAERITETAMVTANC